MAFPTLAQMLATLPDGGANTAAEVRTIIEGIIKSKIWATASLDDPDDVWWESNLGDFTAVSPGGTQTIVEGDGRLSVRFSGQAATTFNARVKAYSFTIGDSFAVPVRLLAPSADFNMAGIVFSDGAGTTDDMVALIVEVDSSGGLQVLIRSGAFDTISSFGTIAVVAPEAPLPELWIRMTYQAANTWRLAFSPDGYSWTTLGLADETATLTPTHFGLCWSVYGGSHEGLISFGPICKLA